MLSTWEMEVKYIPFGFRSFTTPDGNSSEGLIQTQKFDSGCFKSPYVTFCFNTREIKMDFMFKYVTKQQRPKKNNKKTVAK